MKRVGVIATFLVGLAGMLVPAAASAQECYRQSYGQYYTSQPYVYGYYSGPEYGLYYRNWREPWRAHEWRQREERREREWRRREWREHERWERNRWRNRDGWRY
jgi:hypothetical protein